MPLSDQRAAGPAFAAANRSTGAASQAPERRGSGMVERGQPVPAPRPSLDWTAEVDRAAFDAAWDRERKEAEQHSRAARRAAFKAQRMQEHSAEHSKTFNRRAVRQRS